MRSQGLIRPGWNCWRTAPAERFGVAVDAADYFRALAEVLPRARRSITILGWEFDSRTRLLRCGEAMPDGLPAEIGPLLDALAGRRPGLEIRVLIWDSALLYAMNREFAGYIKMDWLTHPSLRFWFDDSHPIGASHHQKIVVVDDGLAFLGGLDVTSQRWDCREHLPADPRRNDPAYPDYPPFHDVMAVVDGEAAAALAELCRERWAAASGEPPPATPGEAPRWPAGIEVLARNVPVAIARTSPPWDGGQPVHEVETLYLDLIAAARRSIFVENQYLASRSIAAAFEARLRRPDCPEIVVVGPGEPASLLERSTMGVARARICQRLMAADRHGRLGMYAPVSGGGDVKVHSKVMVVDDRWLRVGSANLNNRSMGLDTECDLVIEAPGAARSCRLDLLAEHLGATPDGVAAAEARLGGMRAAIAGLGTGARRLVPLDGREPERVLQIVAATGIPDPDQPVETLVWIDDEGPPTSPPRLGRRLLGLYAVLGAVVAAALLWPLAPPALWRLAQPLLDLAAYLRADPVAAGMVAALVVLGGLLRAPPALMALAAAMLLGTVAGAALSLLGATFSAVLLYLFGRELGRARVRRLAGARAGRVKQALTRHGIFSVALLRLMPGAAFWVVNLVAGAGRVRLRDFVVGTIVGMAPGLFAMSVLGDQALRVLRRPDVVNIVGLAAVALVVVAAGLALVARLSRVGRGRRILEV